MIRHCLFQIAIALIGTTMLLAIIPAPVVAQESVESDYEPWPPRVTKGLWFNGSVYALYDDGELMRLSEDTQTGPHIETPGPVRDICLLDGRLVIIVPPQAPSQPVTLHHLGSNGWQELASIVLEGDEQAFNLACDQGEALLLTSKAIVRPLSGSRLPLIYGEGYLRDGYSAAYGSASLLHDGDTLWMGVNSGEFGGGLHRIDLRTGDFSTLGPQDSGDWPCIGFLNYRCNSVHGMVRDPAHPDCILAATGLEHIFTFRGFLARICPDLAEYASFWPAGSAVPLTGSEEEHAQHQRLAPYGSIASDGQQAYVIAGPRLQIMRADGAMDVVDLHLENWREHQRADWSHAEFVVINGDIARSGPPLPYFLMIVPRERAL